MMLILFLKIMRFFSYLEQGTPLDYTNSKGLTPLHEGLIKLYSGFLLLSCINSMYLFFSCYIREL